MLVLPAQRNMSWSVLPASNYLSLKFLGYAAIKDISTKIFKASNGSSDNSAKVMSAESQL